MSCQRINIDFGPAVLPVGELRLQDISSLPSNQIKNDALKLQAMLLGKGALSPSHDGRNSYSAIQQIELCHACNVTDSHAAEKKIEELCDEISRGACQQVRVQLEPTVLPDTWIAVHRDARGLQVTIETASNETRSWLQSASSKLAADLQGRLHCLVTVTVSGGHDLVSGQNNDAGHQSNELA